jgi:catechol 2,3-dioxygenase
MRTRSGSDILAATTGLGSVTLKVANLDVVTDYYARGVGMTVLAQTGDNVLLGRNGIPLLTLEHTPLLKHASETAAGLYHTAFLFESKSELAASVYSVSRKYPTSFTGSSDHLVSNALYFNDPEGNGVELYWDRPRSEWTWHGDTVDIGSTFLDPNRFLQDNITQAGMDAPGDGEASIGHVHLKVGDIPTAREFYVDVVGFEPTTTFGTQALFVSAGKYHHHLGLNTWHSQGASFRSPALGLGQFTIELASQDDRGSLIERLVARNIQIRDDDHVLSFDDPWSNEISAYVQRPRGVPAG